MRFLFGLRGRVWLLVALVTLPLFSYSIVLYLEQRKRVLARVEEDFQRLIQSALVEESYRVRHTREILGIMAHSPGEAGDSLVGRTVLLYR